MKRYICFGVPVKRIRAAADKIAASTPERRMTASRKDTSRHIRAPRGSEKSCRSWLTEAAYRMIQNNLDAEVAENPQELVVYGGIGRAARDWDCYDAILDTLRTLGDDQTLLVQSGKPVGVFPSHPDAPRVLLANSNLVPHWATWEHFNELDRKGLMMYGQMTAARGSTSVRRASCRAPTRPSWKWAASITAASSAASGSSPPAWAAWAARSRWRRRSPAPARSTSSAGSRASTCACARATSTSRPATSTMRSRASRSTPGKARRSRSRCSATPRKSCPSSCAAACARTRSPTRPPRTIRCTATCRSAGASTSGSRSRRADPRSSVAQAKESMRVHVEAMLAFQQQGVPTFDYGNNIRQMAFDVGCKNAFDFPGFVPAYVRPLFCRGVGPFRWVALSGDPEDIYKTDAEGEGAAARQQAPAPLAGHGQGAHQLPGPAARICWVGLGDRHRLALAFNEMVAKGELKAPIVIGRDPPDSGSVASPNRETEAMRDGSDAVSDWPLLNACSTSPAAPPGCRCTMAVASAWATASIAAW
jgi:urocanate hydratase